MSIYEDANLIYQGGFDSINSAKWKYRSQLFEMNHLLETAKLQKAIRDRTYKTQKGQDFVISERGKKRTVTSIPCVDKTINHLLCDEVLTPILDKYLIYDNSSSRVGKGVSFHRERLEQHLHEYYRKYKTNEGYILLGDFKNYYGSINTGKSNEMLMELLEKSQCLTDEDMEATKWLLETIFGDRTGINIGGQPSQNVGIIYAHEVDNYVQTVRSQRWYARYSDDFRIISNNKDELFDILKGIKEISAKIGLKVHPHKTHIARIDKPFTHLQISYRLSESGKIIKRIKPKSLKRERDKLKAYKRLLIAGRMSNEDIENAFKCWLMNNYKVMSAQQIQNINNLYQELFERSIKWENSRLNYLTEVKLKI